MQMPNESVFDCYQSSGWMSSNRQQCRHSARDGSGFWLTSHYWLMSLENIRNFSRLHSWYLLWIFCPVIFTSKTMVFLARGVEGQSTLPLASQNMMDHRTLSVLWILISYRSDLSLIGKRAQNWQHNLNRGNECLHWVQYLFEEYFPKTRSNETSFGRNEKRNVMIFYVCR